MKSSQQLFVAVSVSFLVLKAVSTHADTSLPGKSYWCGTLDRELEVKTYSDRVDLLNPDSDNGPVVTDQAAVSNSFVSRAGSLYQAQTQGSSIEMYVSPAAEPGTDIYSGWISIKGADAQTHRFDITCVVMQ